MQIEVKEVDYCKLEVNYSADPDIVKSKYQEVISEFKRVKLPGFRIGKAPESAIKAVLGKQLAVYVAEKMKSHAFDEAIFESGAKAIGTPKFDDVQIDNSNFSCKMTFLKRPEFELANYNYEIPEPKVLDIDAEVEKALNDLRIRFGEMRPYEDNEFVENGDQITLAYEATVDGEPFDGSKAEGQLYVVGENSLPGFDDNILGMQPGETRTFEVTLPEYLSDVGGKLSVFNVTFHMGTKTVPHALDDTLAKACGVESFENLKDQLRKIALAKSTQAQLLEIRKQVSARLVADNDFKIPSELVTIEAQHMSIQNGIDWYQLSDEQRNMFLEQAEKSVKLSFLLQKIRDVEPDSVLSEEDTKHGLSKRAAIQGNDPEQYLNSLYKSGQYLGIASAFRDEYTLQWVVDRVKLIK